MPCSALPAWHGEQLVSIGLLRINGAITSILRVLRGVFGVVLLRVGVVRVGVGSFGSMEPSIGSIAAYAGHAKRQRRDRVGRIEALPISVFDASLTRIGCSFGVANE